MTLMASAKIFLRRNPWGPGDSYRIAVVEHGMFDLNDLVVEPTHLKHSITVKLDRSYEGSG